MRFRLTDPRLFLALALMVSLLFLLLSPGSRPMFQMVMHGIGGDLPPQRLLWLPDEAGAEDARSLLALAVIGAAAKGDPRAHIGKAVESDPEDIRLQLLRALYATGEPRLLSAPERRDGVALIDRDLQRMQEAEPSNAAIPFYRAIVLINDGSMGLAGPLIQQASEKYQWRTGLDLLNGVAPAIVAQRYRRDLRRVLGALECTPMVSIRPAVIATAAYLALGSESEELDPAERVTRTLQVARLSLLIRGTPERTSTEQALADQMLGQVRRSADLLPPETELPGRPVLDRVIRMASPRAGYLHVLREHRNRLSRSGMVALGGMFLWSVWWGASAILLLVGLFTLASGAIPSGGLGFGEEGPPALQITRLIWIGGAALGALLLVALGAVQSSTPSGMWSSTFRWLLERTVVLAGAALLCALLLVYVRYSRGLLAQPLGVAMQILMVTAGIVVLGYAASILPETRTVGQAMASWYEPPAEVSLAVELERFPVPK